MLALALVLFCVSPAGSAPPPPLPAKKYVQWTQNVTGGGSVNGVVTQTCVSLSTPVQWGNGSTLFATMFVPINSTHFINNWFNDPACTSFSSSSPLFQLADVPSWGPLFAPLATASVAVLTGLPAYFPYAGLTFTFLPCASCLTLIAVGQTVV